MKGDPEQRAIQLGEYIAAHRTTVRAAAAVFGCSKSTVHKDVAVRLRTLQPELFRQVRAVLAQQSRAASARRRSYPAQIQPQMRDGALSVFVPEACRLFYCRFWGWNWLSAPFSSRLTCA